MSPFEGMCEEPDEVGVDDIPGEPAPTDTVRRLVRAVVVPFIGQDLDVVGRCDLLAEVCRAAESGGWRPQNCQNVADVLLLNASFWDDEFKDRTIRNSHATLLAGRLQRASNCQMPDKPGITSQRVQFQHPDGSWDWSCQYAYCSVRSVH
jgi:hypothetical protein